MVILEGGRPTSPYTAGQIYETFHSTHLESDRSTATSPSRSLDALTHRVNATEEQDGANRVWHRTTDGLHILANAVDAPGLEMPCWRPNYLPGWGFFLNSSRWHLDRRVYLSIRNDARQRAFETLCATLHDLSLEFEAKVAMARDESRVDSLVIWCGREAEADILRVVHEVIPEWQLRSELPGLAVPLSHGVAGAWESRDYRGKSYGQYMSDLLANAFQDASTGESVAGVRKSIRLAQALALTGIAA